MSWIRASPLSELRAKGRALARLGRRQIVLFAVGDRVFAVDNRCPHEGYPLLQGSVDPETGELTCQWHNWKFALETGECVLGEDHVRSYPTKVEDGWVHVDVSEPPAESYRTTILEGVTEAVTERQYSRIAREVSRLLLRGLDPVDAVRVAVERTYDRFEFGTTHAFAAAADWLALYRREDDRERKVICLTEAIDHMAKDALRHPRYPYPEDAAPFDGPAFLEAVEAEDEARAVRLVRRTAWDVLEPWLARAALAHYNDFGHTAIYVYKTRQLLHALGEGFTSALALPLTRMLCYTTREDLLPDFRAYGDALAHAPEAAGTTAEPLDVPFGKSTKEALAWVLEKLPKSSPRAIYRALLDASALNLLRFDERHDRASSRSVSQNAGWLFFTHAITFANACRVLAEKDPELWPRALLQMACFVGRNKRFVDGDANDDRWQVDDESTFLAWARSAVLDHGRQEPIYSAHLIKTLTATEEELPHAATGRAHLLAALNRFLNAPIKEKHPLRTARQALALAEASV